MNYGSARAWGGKGGSALPPIGIHTKLFDKQKKKEVFLWYSQIEYDSGCIWNLKNIVKNIEKISSK